MARIFLNHSSKNDPEALAIRDWLAREGWDDVFLDLSPMHGIAPGERWQRALNNAAGRCELVLFLISREWLASPWCLSAFTLANALNKRLIGLLVEDVALENLPSKFTAAWQLVRLSPGHDPITFNVALPNSGEERQVSFSQAGLLRLKIGLERAGLDSNTFAWPPENDPNRSPYRGLRPLEAEDAGVFFGREASIVEALDHLRGLRDASPPRLFVVLGASGSGKSSFLRAGILPRLKRDDRNFLTLPLLRPERAAISGENGLVRSLELAFQEHRIATTRSEIRAAIDGGVQALRPLLAKLQDNPADGSWSEEPETRKPILLLPIDQGEDLFLAEGHAEAQLLLTLLADLLFGSEPDFLALIVLRSDFYERLQTEPALEGVREQTLSLPPMPRSAHKSIIEGPAGRMRDGAHALQFEPILTEALLSDLPSDGGGDALPLLAFTLERLYHEFGEKRHVSLEHYRELGGIKGSIEDSVKRAFLAADINPEIPRDHAARLALLRRAYIPWLARIDLETGTPRRRIARISEIPAEALPLVRELIEQRLLIADVSRETGEATIEPAHEALLRQWTPLVGWIKEDFANLAVLEGVTRAARDYAANNRNPDWLIHTGGRLEDAERLKTRPDLAQNLTPVEQAYLADCRKRESTKRHGEGPPGNRKGEPQTGAVQVYRPAPRPRGTKIFISYRRTDTRHVSGRIFDSLSQKFSSDEIFFDVDTIPIGTNFRDYIRGAIQSSAIVLAVIGQNWISRSRFRRLLLGMGGEDFVLTEIELAFEVGVPILPILIDDTLMPPTARIPASIRPLADLNAATVRAGRDFATDIRRVIEIVEPLREQGRLSVV